jgi:hypothetical protein
MHNLSHYADFRIMPHGAMERVIKPIICHAVFGIIRALPGTRATDRWPTPDRVHPVPMGKLQDIRKEQWVAARSVERSTALSPRLDYLIGEKLLTYAEMAVTKPEFGREPPRLSPRSAISSMARRSGTTSIVLSDMAALDDEQATRTTTNYLVTFPTDSPQSGRFSLS